MQEDIKKIIAASINAPSGENCQPWRFVIEGEKLSIYNIPEADQSLYNFRQHGSLAGNGAFIENMSIAASKFGYKTIINLFPDKSDQNLVAVISFEKTTPAEDPLFSALVKRCTNRKDYTGQKLSVDQKNALIDAIKEAGFGELRLVDDEDSLKKIGGAFAVNEQIVFENKNVHDFFYTHILWNEEDQYKAGGFYVKTLEFLPHQIGPVKLFKNWPILKAANIVGASKLIYKENADKYAKSGTVGAIIVDSATDEDYVKIGRAIERMWLTAANLNLALHPNTGTLYFAHRIQSGDTSAFSGKHVKAIQDGFATLQDVFNTKGKTIAFTFRIGFADAPSAMAIKMLPKIEVRQ